MIPGQIKKNKFSKYYAEHVDSMIKSDKNIESKNKNFMNFWSKNPALMADAFIPNLKLSGAEYKQHNDSEKQKEKDRKKNK